MALIMTILGLNQHHQSTLMNSDGQIHNGQMITLLARFSSDELARIFAKNKTQEKVNYVLHFSLLKKTD